MSAYKGISFFQRQKSVLRSLSLVGLSLSVVSGASASRYIVQLRSTNTFKQVEAQLEDSINQGLGARDAFGQIALSRPAFLGTQARVTQTLKNLDMVVVESNDPASIAALKNNPDVALVEEEFFVPAPQMPVDFSNRSLATSAAPEEITWGLKAVRAPEAWNKTQGAGARVMILDTGIDRDHPELKNRFEAGKNFVEYKTPSRTLLPAMGSALFQTGAELFASSGGETLSNPPYDYFDLIGHGTHVAGTIAAEADGKGVVGVAPQAKLLMGRVCGKFGCSSVAIVNGVNWAISQGVDVISMSLGGPMGSSAQEAALDRAAAAGVINVAASGNGGNDSVSFPGAFSSVIAVGAINSKLERADFSQYGPELAIMAPGVDVLSSVPMGSGRASIVKVQLSGVEKEVPSTSFVGSAEAFEALNGQLQLAGLGKEEDFGRDFSGKIALIQRGEIPFADKVKNAIAAHAAGVLVYNNVDGLISGALTQDGSAVAIPVAMVEKAVGEELKSALLANSVASASIKTLRTDYASFQGTSMATPHVAGVVALVKSANKLLKQEDVRRILAQTATKLSGPNSHNELGNGLINAEAAVNAAASAR